METELSSPEIRRYVDRESQDDGRAADGRFAPGASGNPAGRPRGSRGRVARELEAMLTDKHGALMEKVLERALEGDVAALRLCLNRLAPAPKDEPLQFELPRMRSPADIMNAAATVLRALGDGEVTPLEAERVMALLTNYKELIKDGVFVPYEGGVDFDEFLRRFPSGWLEEEEEEGGGEEEDHAA